MTVLDQTEQLLSKLNQSEKVQLLHRLVRQLGDPFPGIDVQPEVCGGDACIVRTRVPVWLLEQARRLGSREEDLLRSYPALRSADLINAWEYVRSHSDEINRQIQEHEAA